MSHTTYGLTMSDGLWRAACSCGWHGSPSLDLVRQTAELDAHLRVVVVSEQRPTRLRRVATGAVLEAVDHTVVLSAVLVTLLSTLAVLVRRG